MPVRIFMNGAVLLLSTLIIAVITGRLLNVGIYSM